MTAPWAWRWAKQEGDGAVRFVLGGAITETTDFAPLLDAAAGPVTLDLGDVQRINSCGVREWIHFLDALEGKATSVALERCPPALVRQLNVIANACGAAHVRSVLLPYFCEGCEAEHTVGWDVVAGALPDGEAARPCPTCGANMTFDDVVESYLAFLARRSTGSTPT